MARNTVVYVIIMTILIIGVVICFENIELQKTIIERPSTTLYPTSKKSSSSIEECVKTCRKLMKTHEDTLNCIYICVINECSLRFPNVKDRIEKETCIGTLLAKYDETLH
ncbi:hypothetical protein PIB30_099489 [Stylosanthes scabra]|uniref:Uncharacterized protein n=1 Tax=Stylosanthes scabra TaxID=79078 RepID=A0ABU6RX41_9FABA|nr:hypothetical protein [Stylosanthes scabra]